MLGIWVDENESAALVIKIVGTSQCNVERRRVRDGSLIDSGPLRTTPNIQGWRVWDSSSYGGDEDVPERLRLSDRDKNLLQTQLPEVWGDWDDSSCYRRSSDEVLHFKLLPKKKQPTVDGSPVQQALLSEDTALVGSGDGHVRLVTSDSSAWSKHVREWLPLRVGMGFDYGVNAIVFSTEGRYAFLGISGGECKARQLATHGQVICLDIQTSEKIWSWPAHALRNRSIVHVEALGLAPDGDCFAVACNRERFFGMDGQETPPGNDYLVYLESYANGSLVEVRWSQPHDRKVVALAHSPHSVYLAFCFESESWLNRQDVTCLATESGAIIWRCPMPGQKLSQFSCASKLQFTPGGRFLVCAAWGHSTEEHDDFPGSMGAEADDDDMCTVTCIGIESGLVVWRSKPIPDFVARSMQLSVSSTGHHVLIACRLDGRWWEREDGSGRDFYKGAVVCLDAQTGNLLKKAYPGLPDTIELLSVKHCSESQVVFAVDAWANEASVKAYRLHMRGPPENWSGQKHGWMLSKAQWPADSSPELLWTHLTPEVKHNLTGFAFKPLVPAMDDLLESESPHEHAVDPANVASSSSAMPRRRSHRQRQRKKKYLATVLL
ncbi:unnamed protein product [Symbiodinium natans]|uniref:Uncharacterized protein n=1 Tax=Symbiodinium natans TaxID=878477 RepID=A0A812TYZ1_9DINO|nr:unnamed protein product [Symbiodinium natans]